MQLLDNNDFFIHFLRRVRVPARHIDVEVHGDHFDHCDQKPKIVKTNPLSEILKEKRKV